MTSASGEPASRRSPSVHRWSSSARSMIPRTGPELARQGDPYGSLGTTRKRITSDSSIRRRVRAENDVSGSFRPGGNDDSSPSTTSAGKRGAQPPAPSIVAVTLDRDRGNETPIAIGWRQWLRHRSPIPAMWDWRHDEESRCRDGPARSPTGACRRASQADPLDRSVSSHCVEGVMIWLGPPAHETTTPIRGLRPHPILHARANVL